MTHCRRCDVCCVDPLSLCVWGGGQYLEFPDETTGHLSACHETLCFGATSQLVVGWHAQRLDNVPYLHTQTDTQTHTHTHTDTQARRHTHGHKHADTVRGDITHDMSRLDEYTCEQHRGEVWTSPKQSPHLTLLTRQALPMGKHSMSRTNTCHTSNNSSHHHSHPSPLPPAQP